MMSKIIFILLLLAMLTADLWAWSFFYSDTKVDWFLLVEDSMKPHWYVKFTATDLLIISLLIIIHFHGDKKLSRIAKYSVFYMVLKNICFWLFHDKITFTPYLMMLVSASLPVILFENYQGLRKYMLCLWQKFM